MIHKAFLTAGLFEFRVHPPARCMLSGGSQLQSRGGGGDFEDDLPPEAFL